MNVVDHTMNMALDQARMALERGEAPIGCVVLDERGEVAGSAYNTVFGSGVVTAHAEINAFHDAADKIQPRRRYSMFTTLEPCVMCLGAAMQAGVTEVVFALSAPADAGCGRVAPPQSPNSTSPRIVGPVQPEQSRALFVQWLERHANDPSRAAQREFIEQLLALTPHEAS